MTLKKFRAVTDEDHIRNRVLLVKQPERHIEKIKNQAEIPRSPGYKISIKLALLYLCKRDGKYIQTKHLSAMQKAGIIKKTDTIKKNPVKFRGGLANYCSLRPHDSDWEKWDKLNDELAKPEVENLLKAKLG